jgi:hypothetical protein
VSRPQIGDPRPLFPARSSPPRQAMRMPLCQTIPRCRGRSRTCVATTVTASARAWARAGMFGTPPPLPGRPAGASHTSEPAASPRRTPSTPNAPAPSAAAAQRGKPPASAPGAERSVLDGSTLYEAGRVGYSVARSDQTAVPGSHRR